MAGTWTAKQRGALAAAIAAVLIIAALPLAAGTPTARAAAFPDIGAEPADIQQAIDYVTEKGYMNGSADGNFDPDNPVLRLEYAYAVVRLFGKDGGEPDPGIVFTDMDSSSEDYRYANLAVKHGYMGIPSGGCFEPNEEISTAGALEGLVRGMGLDAPAKQTQGIYTKAPAHTGFTVVAHDLHLKQRDTCAWPTDSYRRAEMAFSLEAADNIDEWREEYVNDSFDWLRCQTPLMGKQRENAIASAFAKIGYPYVWGGESDAEHGYDCSGLVYYVLGSRLGYPMMRVADDQARDGRYPVVTRKELLAGDPIFFHSSSSDTPGYVGHAGMYIGHDLFIHSTGSNAGVSVDRLTGYWEEQFACGKRVISEKEPESFDTYILLANPASSGAEVELNYMLLDGRQITCREKLDPYSRKTVKVDDTLFNQEVSVAVEAVSGQVIAERSMYFNYLKKYPGGHDSPGVREPAQNWYLAEGCTARGFDTYVLIGNPGSEAADVTVTFMTDSGGTVDVQCVVAPFSRYTVEVDSVPGMEAREFSTRVTAGSPVVVERSMYFDYLGITDGHNSPGVTELSNVWYFAEGYTGGGFDTYVLMSNPGSQAADVTVTLLADDGTREETAYVVDPHSRRTVAVDNIEGWEAREFSVLAYASEPIVAERAMYFDYNGITGGHDAMGTPAPAREWYLAEGYTGDEFDTYILIANPSPTIATVSVRFMMNGGRFIDREYEVGVDSRFTIAVDKIKGMSDEEVSAYISSSTPVVVERSIYFNYLDRPGGTCAPGVTSPSDEWYFAEGYTGM
ncbi:MAG: C40 family peptidase [Actinobacteria bacterium]|nr:C40 family peptidase [Actinomycetota bacterium]MBU4217469.1 C40 family peptidase [Actinomycetota bacterium]MCG2818199.1 DUF5719 family protein [Actinomycetes bacterium]